jgi:hypothetical protein
MKAAGLTLALVAQDGRIYTVDRTITSPPNLLSAQLETMQTDRRSGD